MHYSSVGTKKRWNLIGVVENTPLLWNRVENQLDDVRTRDDCLFEWTIRTNPDRFTPVRGCPLYLREELLHLL